MKESTETTAKPRTSLHWLKRLVSVFYKKVETKDGVKLSGLVFIPVMLPFAVLGMMLMAAALISTLIPGRGKWSKSGEKWYEWEWNSFS